MLSDQEFNELRELNEPAVEGASCLFDDESDPDHVPEGYSCGGCGCHLSAPCNHCLHHLPRDESSHISVALRLSGRWTR